MITVVAALFEKDGCLLICQRRRRDSFALKWEFPGGKIQPGESPIEALVRELGEELGVKATVGREVFRTRHRYAEHCVELELIFFAASMDAQVPQNLAFEQFHWAQISILHEYDFLPADRELIGLLSSGALRVP